MKYIPWLALLCAIAALNLSALPDRKVVADDDDEDVDDNDGGYRSTGRPLEK